MAIRRQTNTCNATWLIVARQSRGLTQKELAASLSVNQGWLSRVEGGLRSIPEEKVKHISELLGYPVEFFYQTDPPNLLSLTNVFHRKIAVPNKVLDTVNGQLTIISTAMHQLLQGIDIDGTDMQDVDLEEFTGSIEDVAQMVRANWGVPRGPVQNVTRLIEKAGAIVIPFDFGTRRIDATSLWLPKSKPLFFVNPAVPGDRLRFTLCHELGHIIMHRGTIRENSEEEANRFAAEFLMPARQIEPYLHGMSLPKLATLKIQWRVSMAALLKRAQTLGTITPSQAKSLWVQMGPYRQREPDELDIPMEMPSLYREIVDVYQNELGYDLPELASLLCLSQRDTATLFLNPLQLDPTAAVEEAERLMRGH